MLNLKRLKVMSQETRWARFMKKKNIGLKSRASVPFYRLIYDLTFIILAVTYLGWPKKELELAQCVMLSSTGPLFHMLLVCRDPIIGK